MSKRLLTLFLTCLTIAFMTACSGDDSSLPAEKNNQSEKQDDTPEKEDDDSDNGDKDNNGDTVMSIADRKEYLEKVGMELMDMVPSSDFDKYREFFNSICPLFKDYVWDTAAEWGEDAFDATMTFLGSSDSSVLEYDYWYGTTCNLTSLIMAANFTGRFTESSGKWVYSSVSDNSLSFVFKNSKGAECVVKLEASDNAKKVRFGDMGDHSIEYYPDYDAYSNTCRYYADCYFNYRDFTIGLPEKMVLTITQGGDEIVKTEITIDLDKINDDVFDISKNKLAISRNMVLDNGYELGLDISYVGNDSMAASLFFRKNGENLVTFSISGDLSGIPSCNAGAFVEVDYDEDDFDYINRVLRYVKCDILGKVQIQGILSDVRKFLEYMDKANESNKNEASFKFYLNQANALANVNLFYDGTSVKQASVKLEAFENSRYGHWEYEPIICFSDGSSYSTFKAFFEVIK